MEDTVERKVVQSDIEKDIYISFDAKNKNGEDIEYNFQRHMISYFRHYMREDTGINTIVYMQGNQNGVVIPVKPEVVKKKLNSANELLNKLVNLNSLEQKKVLDFIDKL